MRIVRSLLVSVALLGVSFPAVAEDGINYGDQLGVCNGKAKNTFSQNQETPELGGFGGAVYFSQAEANDVAVLVFTGKGAEPDLVLNGGRYFTQLLTEQGLAADCFTAMHRPDRNYGYMFFVNGQTTTGDDLIGPIQANEDLYLVITEARAVRQTGMKGNPDFLLLPDD